VWRIIPSLEFLIQRWETMSTQPKYRNVQAAITEGVQSLKKWYQKVDDTSCAYFICLGARASHCYGSSLTSLPVLDPNVKDLYFRHRWDPDQYDTGMRWLEEVVRKIHPILSLIILI
jgi:hypothetical protein